ncbi:MAG: Nif3-like dinuclear metal center hexameric protein [Spirochaetales bacterium]|nr:Nif3-like dinuclear metal center hexameric protein [Spirochaetales bacterium]
MQLAEFDKFMKELLLIEGIGEIDASLNGLQVSRKNHELKKIAFAVDASMESFKRAKNEGADLLFVHHGLLWKKQQAVTGNFYHRLAFLIQNDLALYAVHLPLDLHPDLGNNIGIARALSLGEIEPFGQHNGIKIGFKGRFPAGKRLEEIVDLLYGRSRQSGVHTLPFGSELIRTVGIVSGGDSKSALQAIGEGLDLFITGDASHEIYHDCLEAGLNVLFGGHYLTEVWGIKQVAEKTKKETDLETVVIDIPTGL